MIHSRTRGARSRALLLLLSALLLVAPLVLLPTAPASAQEHVTTEIVAVSPTVVGPDDTQEITLRVTNDGDTELTGLTVDLGVGWRPVTTRTEVASWSTAETGLAGTQLSEQLDPLPPGESLEVTLSLDVEDLLLGENAPWGPRQMSIRLHDARTTLETLHTFMMYDPGSGASSGRQGAPAPVSLSVAAPVTGPAFDPAAPEDYADAVAAWSAPGAPYDELLAAATSEVGALSLAVDPAVVATAEQSVDDDAARWADLLLREGGPGVVTLPVGDPDLAALAHADVDAQDIARIAGGRDVLPEDWAAADDWGPRIAWPAGVVDAPTVVAADAAGARALLGTEGIALPEAPGSLGSVASGSGPLRVAVPDEAISAVLDDATGSGGAVSEPAATVQRLLADTAVLAADAAEAAAATPVVAALPRGWSPDVATFDAVLGALAEQSWVELTDLGEALAPADDGRNARVAEETVADAELSPGSVRGLISTSEDVAAFATVAADPGTLTAGVDRDLFAPLSIAYRDTPEARAGAVELAQANAAQVRSGISVLDRADVLLISDAGDLPVRIRNDLPVDTRVTVRLRPDDPRLVVETVPEIVVPAGTSRDAQVRVRAIGSGDVTLAVEVLAPSGVEVAPPTEFALRVRAGWETVGTAVMAAGIGLLFLTGIWRTVRRGRSDRRTTGEQVAESAVPTGRTTTVPPQAPSPEDTAS
ncbi:DUF6049 family protein [Isoptericola sediminis]|uniref:Uncharacterized protein n=1 Tax=Isoptericola sediminis TaxID=2733572 RepID=A0A849K448_9MICO|nr:hypothetical protein [Isoptericola sediminis]